MVKVNSEQKCSMLKLIKKLRLLGAKREFVKSEVERVIGVSYCARSILNYEMEAFRDEYIKKLRTDDAIMDRWREEYNSVTALTESELYAENLFELSKSSINP